MAANHRMLKMLAPLIF